MAKQGPKKRLSDPGGQRFGPYELVQRLGVGGMAETFEAIRRGPGDFAQRVCLKLVQPFFRDKPDFLEMFEREARLAAQLRHSNIVGVIDFGRIDGATYMALELVDGTDLAALLDSQPGRRLSPGRVALIGHDLAQALEHAHDPRRDGTTGADKTIIHRDVSPSNVMISRRGEVLLTDFGVAKAITGTARKQSAVKGKVPYMSPEQLRAEHLDGRSDLFSLGVVLFEALAGRRPFQGEHDPATIMKILHGDRPSLKSLVPGAPAELCEVIESLLAADPQQRPVDATRLLELLEPFLPPPRERRELGRMASEARALRATSSEPLGGGATGETSGVSGSSGSLASGGNWPGPETKAERGRRRHLLWLLVAALVAAWMFWGRHPTERTDRPVPPEGAMPAEQSSTKVSPAPPPATPNMAHEDTRQSEGEGTSASSRTEGHSEGQAEGAGSPGHLNKEPLPPPRAHPASLSVFVFPWGRVWINGRPYGRAPLQNVSLAPGKYKVSAGREAASEHKSVRLRSGDRRSIQFNLTK
ncbi:MAG: serine/threonine-protein kinase [Myxococcales bacterium]|jgi:serine/threonine protein kinase